MAIPVQCPHCFEMLRLKDSASEIIGQTMPCTKCTEPFVIQRYRDHESYFEPDDKPANHVGDSNVHALSGVVAQPPLDNGARIESIGANPGFSRKALLSVVGSGVAVLLLFVVKMFLPATDSHLIAVPLTLNVASSPAEPMSSGPHGNQTTAITDEEYDNFALKFQARINAQDMSVMRSLVNWDVMVQNSAAGLPLDAEFVAGFKQGVVDTMPDNLMAEILPHLGKTGHYRFLRQHSVGLEKRLLFRLALDSAGLNYHDYVMGRRPDGQLEIVDIHVATTGELMSQSFHNALVMAAVAKKGFLGELTVKQNELEASLPLFRKFNAHKNAGQFEEALEAFKRLPVSIRKQKAQAITRAMMAQKVSGTEYLSALEDFRQSFPDDACMDFMSIDFHVLRREFDQALEAIDNVDRSVGGDPYLNLSRAAVYLAQKKFREAYDATELVIQTEPDLIQPVFFKVTLGLEAREFGFVLETLKTLKIKHNVSLKNLRNLPEYAEFVESPEYQEWLQFTNPSARFLP